jgi:hypothetical protein
MVTIKSTQHSGAVLTTFSYMLFISGKFVIQQFLIIYLVRATQDYSQDLITESQKTK